ncbi:hypothetical protein Esti_006385 [Eimeria stiedai]
MGPYAPPSRGRPSPLPQSAFLSRWPTSLEPRGPSRNHQDARSFSVGSSPPGDNPQSLLLQGTRQDGGSVCCQGSRLNLRNKEKLGSAAAPFLLFSGEKATLRAELLGLQSKGKMGSHDPHAGLQDSQSLDAERLHRRALARVSTKRRGACCSGSDSSRATRSSKRLITVSKTSRPSSSRRSLRPLPTEPAAAAAAAATEAAAAVLSETLELLAACLARPLEAPCPLGLSLQALRPREEQGRAEVLLEPEEDVLLRPPLSWARQSQFADLLRASPTVRLTYNSMLNPPGKSARSAVSVPVPLTVPSTVSCAAFRASLPQGPLPLRCLESYEEGLLLLGLEPSLAAGKRQPTSSPYIDPEEATCSKVVDTVGCSSLGATTSCLFLAEPQAPNGSAAAAAAAGATDKETATSCSTAAAQLSSISPGMSEAMVLEEAQSSGGSRARESSSINSTRAPEKERLSSSGRPRDTQMIDGAITKALLRLTAASRKAAASAAVAAGDRRRTTANRPSTASVAAGWRSREPSAVMPPAAAAAAASAALPGFAAVPGEGTQRSNSSRPISAGFTRSLYTRRRRERQEETPAGFRAFVENAAAWQLQQQAQQHLLREQVLQHVRCSLEEDEPSLEAVLQMCNSETLEELLQSPIRRVKTLLQLLMGAEGKARVLLGESLVLSLTALFLTIDEEIAAYQRYAADLEAGLALWQQREVSVQQVLQQLQHLQLIAASHERLRAEERKRHEEAEAGLTEKVEELQREVARLAPEETLIAEARDRHEELVMLLQRREAQQQVQQELLLDAQQLLRMVSLGKQKPMESLSDRETGRVYETKEGELCFRPYGVVETGVLATAELLSRPQEQAKPPPISLVPPRLRLFVTRHTSPSRGPPPLLSLEQLSSVAAAAYEAKAAADAASPAASVVVGQPQSLLQALEEHLTLKFSADAEVQQTLASLTQTLLQQQQQHQQQPVFPASPSLREAQRFARLLGLCTLDDYLPLPCLNIFLFIRQQLHKKLSPRCEHQANPGSPAAAERQKQGAAASAVEKRPLSAAVTRSGASEAAADAVWAQDASSSSSSNNSSNNSSSSSTGLCAAVAAFVLGVDALEGSKEAAAAALLLGLAKRSRLGFVEGGGFSAVNTPCKQHMQLGPPRSPRRTPAAATAAAAAAAAAAAVTEEGRARLLLCGLLHQRLQQGRLKTLQRHLNVVEGADSKLRNKAGKSSSLPNPPSMTLAEVQAVRLSLTELLRFFASVSSASRCALSDAAGVSFSLTSAPAAAALPSSSRPQALDVDTARAIEAPSECCMRRASPCLQRCGSRCSTETAKGDETQYLEVRGLVDAPPMIVDLEHLYEVLFEAFKADFAAELKPLEEAYKTLASEGQTSSPFSSFRGFHSLLVASRVADVSPQAALLVYKEMQRLRDCCTREQQIIESQGCPLELQQPPLDAPAAEAVSLLLLRYAAANMGWLVRSRVAAAGLPLFSPATSMVVFLLLLLLLSVLLLPLLSQLLLLLLQLLVFEVKLVVLPLQGQKTKRGRKKVAGGSRKRTKSPKAATSISRPSTTAGSKRAAAAALAASTATPNRAAAGKRKAG